MCIVKLLQNLTYSVGITLCMTIKAFATMVYVSCYVVIIVFCFVFAEVGLGLGLRAGVRFRFHIRVCVSMAISR